MKYLCLIYIAEAERQQFQSMPAADYEASITAHLAYDDALRESGHYIAAEALADPGAGTIVRVRNGQISVTDGPFIESKEQVAGFYLINARDLNEAIQIAAKIPSAPVGHVEVRPIFDLAQAGPQS